MSTEDMITDDIIQKWQEKVAVKLLLWKEKLIQTSTETIYGYLCAAALLPVLEAMQSGDLSLLTALNTSLGGNLLTAQLEAIKIAGEGGTPHLLEAQAKKDKEYQEALDTLLKKLDVIELVRGSMNEDDRALLFDQLDAQMPKSHSRQKTKRSVFVSGDLKYSIINTGDGVRITQYQAGSIHEETHIHYPDPLEIAATIKQQKLNNYLTALIRKCQILPLLAVGGQTTADIDKITLDNVYIELDVYENQADKENRLSALQVALETSRLVLLGDPGSGKSTFIKMMARQAAEEYLNKADNPRLGGIFFPIIIILRELQFDLQPAIADIPTDDIFLDLFKAYITKTLNAFEIFDFEVDFLTLLQSQSTNKLFIFDGIDEVPQELRKQARLWIETILQHYRPQKVCLTCRTRSYHDQAVIPDFRTYTLAPFTKAQIDKFSHAWYSTKAELNQQKKKERAEDFLNRIKADSKIFLLATNPLLLTQMAVLHQRDTRLPSHQVKLYEEIVLLLLHRWQDHSQVLNKMSDKLASLLNQENVIRLAIEHLAFESHRRTKAEKYTIDLPKLFVLDLLANADHFGGFGLAEEFLSYLDQRSGLIKGAGGTINQPETYSFPHRTFQEYLAGCYLNRQNLSRKLKQLAEIAGEGDFWNVVFLLSIEESVYIGKNPDLVDLAALMCDLCEIDTERGHRLVYWSALIKDLLGESTILAYDDPDLNINTGHQYLTNLKERLITVAMGSKLTPVERAETADILDGLGYVPDDLYDFIEIPGDNVYPTFWIGKYPVTNLQYERFLTPTNFVDRSLWMDLPYIDETGERTRTLGDEGWLWLQDLIGGEKILFPRYWHDHRFGKARSCAPVVGVSWYESMAYGRWLQRNWVCLAEASHNQKSSNPNIIRLPVDTEWEKAAGGTENDRHAWDAPGETSDRKKLVTCANTTESSIKRTTPVWTYPQGQSVPYGLADMSGNVWEWQANRFAAGSNSIMLRGGAWLNYQKFTRCAYRGSHNPGSRYFDNGFRLCVHL